MAASSFAPRPGTGASRGGPIPRAASISFLSVVSDAGSGPLGSCPGATGQVFSDTAGTYAALERLNTLLRLDGGTV